MFIQLALFTTVAALVGGGFSIATHPGDWERVRFVAGWSAVIYAALSLTARIF